MMTIPFEELMRYEVTNDEDYYAIIQFLKERNDLFDCIEKELKSGEPDEDNIEMHQLEIDVIDIKIKNIRKKYNKILKRLEI